MIKVEEEKKKNSQMLLLAVVVALVIESVFVLALPAVAQLTVRSEMPDIYNLTARVAGDMPIKIIVTDLHSSDNSALKFRSFWFKRLLKVFVNTAQKFNATYYQRELFLQLGQWNATDRVVQKYYIEGWKVCNYTSKSEEQPFVRVKWCKIK